MANRYNFSSRQVTHQVIPVLNHGEVREGEEKDGITYIRQNSGILTPKRVLYRHVFALTHPKLIHGEPFPTCITYIDGMTCDIFEVYMPYSNVKVADEVRVENQLAFDHRIMGSIMDLVDEEGRLLTKINPESTEKGECQVIVRFYMMETNRRIYPAPTEMQPDAYRARQKMRSIEVNDTSHIGVARVFKDALGSLPSKKTMEFLEHKAKAGLADRNVTSLMHHAVAKAAISVLPGIGEEYVAGQVAKEVKQVAEDRVEKFLRGEKMTGSDEKKLSKAVKAVKKRMKSSQNPKKQKIIKQPVLALNTLVHTEYARGHAQATEERLKEGKPIDKSHWTEKDHKDLKEAMFLQHFVNDKNVKQ